MQSASPTGLAVALGKLLDVVETENAFLQRHDVISHASFTDKKNQALRELLAAQRSSPQEAKPAALAPLAEKLTRALKTNSRLLKIHIAALGEVSDVIIGSIREAESDGTYGRKAIQAYR